MTTITLIALGLSAALYLTIAIRAGATHRKLSDHLPVSNSGAATVQSSGEFSASTVATTVSLATVILAYTELAGGLGLWLLWTVVTTVVGLLMVRYISRPIWRRLQQHGEHKPTLHQFLGASFGSPAVAVTAAVATSIGFLGALAVELTVGSRFLAGLAPGINPTAAVIVLSAIGVVYTMIGGFRAVIVTDRIQMKGIYVCIAVLIAVIAWQINAIGMTTFSASVPNMMTDFSWREGLGPFLLGIAVINIASFMADMSVWQRVAATKSESILNEGLTASAVGAGISWTLLALIACAIAVLAKAPEGTNPLLTFLVALGSTGTTFAVIALLIIITGLYAASLSTASTQLIAVGQTLHTDILRRDGDQTKMAESASELRVSRFLLLVVAAISILVVELLQQAGFSIADLVFAIYGSQLALVPVVLLALFGNGDANKRMGSFAVLATVLGFAAGWALAGYGKFTGDGNFVFLSPVASLMVSSCVCLVGAVIAKR